MGFTISSNGKSMAFGVAHETDPEETFIFLLNFRNGKWSSPDKNILPGNVNTSNPMFGPDETEFYFAKSTDDAETDLWVASYTGNEVIEPKLLGSVFNSASREAGHGKSKNGSFYFTSNRDDKHPCCGDIYRSKPDKSGNYSSVMKMEELNSDEDEESLFLSPKEDYIIIQAWKNEFESKHDLYISYLTRTGSWTIPERLDSAINGRDIEQRPFVSPDNKYLFFTRMSVTSENGTDIYESDIYWVSTQSIFKPYPYNTNNIERQMAYKEPFQIKLPEDIFRDADDNIRSYVVTLNDNLELPEWINFDESKLLLTGTWETKEPVMLNITAIDEYGNEGVLRVPMETKSN